MSLEKVNYTKWAVEHITFVEDLLSELRKYKTSDLIDIIDDIHNGEEREKADNDYYEAKTILEVLYNAKDDILHLKDLPPGKTFKEDQSEKNPSLHLLYVKWAVKHLTFFDKALQKINEFSNTNTIDIYLNLRKGVEKLEKENKAYADAREILNTIRKVSSTAE